MAGQCFLACAKIDPRRGSGSAAAWTVRPETCPFGNRTVDSSQLSDPSNAERSLSEANRRLLKVRQAAEISQAMRTAKIRGKMRASGLGLQTRI